MTIKIAHLYYDLMNLYGENGNVRALKRFFEYQGINTEIHFLTVNDKIDFNKYDCFYIGCGTEKSELIVLEDLKKRKQELVNAIENNKYFFLTGNAYELFGKYIIDFNKNKIETLDIFPYYTKVIDFSPSIDINFRIVGSILGSTSLIDKNIIGFENRCGTIFDSNNPLFEYSFGMGYSKDNNYEGYQYKNVYATYLLGPLFIRNPYLTDYFVRKIVKEKNKDYKFKTINNLSEVKAYNTYLKILEK